jgi:hypothetical protein
MSQLFFGNSYIKFLLKKIKYYLRNIDFHWEILKNKVKIVFGKITIIIFILFTIKMKLEKENKIFLEMQEFNNQ